MDHRPFEEWLLNDERLTSEQDQDLRVHLRNCPECAALAKANLSLRSAAVVAPANGFSLRFQVRLAAQRKVQRRQTIIGLILLGLVGAGGLSWFLFPYLPYLALPPAQLAGLWFSNLIYVGLTARAFGVLAATILNVVASLIPIYVWIFLTVLLGGLGFLWTVFFRKAVKIAQPAA
jgi:hypothetical protein